MRVRTGCSGVSGYVNISGMTNVIHAEQIGSGSHGRVGPADDPGGQPVILGVCAAISRRTGTSLPLVRAAVIAMATAGGLGLVIYLLAAVLWRDREGGDRRPTPGADMGLLFVLAGSIWTALVIWPGVLPGLVVPVGLVSVGVALGWRSAGGSSRSTIRSTAGRIVGGLVLCVTGMAIVLGHNSDLGTLRDTLLALAVALTGIGLVAGPTVVASARALTAERDDRVRAEERARVAAHLHDSVLQTLTLIQKRVDDPAEMASLARQEERSLRAWLYSGADPYSGSTGIRDRAGVQVEWREVFESVVADVERHYAVAVELVMVGRRDHPSTDRLVTVAAAAREAIVNAAKFSAQRNVSVFVEVTEQVMNLYVRDRGIGFDPSSIGPDRHGLRDSIIGRMADIGGSGTVRSAPGEGTEVHLCLPFPDHITTVGSTGSPDRR